LQAFLKAMDAARNKTGVKKEIELQWGAA